MYTQAEKAAEKNKGRAPSKSIAQAKNNQTCCFGFTDNRPEIVAQRKRHVITDNILQARQLGAFHEKAGNVAQLVNIPVGFDNSPTQSMFAGPADDLTTTGLGNCIAIVAYHTGLPSLGAVMRHYDTLNAFVNTVRDPVSGGQALTFNGATIGAVAQATAAQLVANAPAAAGNIGFAVALGGIWSNVNQNTALWQSRFNLINAIVAGVGVQPVIAAGTANFNVATSTLS